MIDSLMSMVTSYACAASRGSPSCVIGQHQELFVSVQPVRMWPVAAVALCVCVFLHIVHVCVSHPKFVVTECTHTPYPTTIS